MTPIRVLLIEDESDLCETTTRYLGLCGFEVAGVGSLAAASQWLSTQSADVLVIDLGLPDGDGLSWLRQHPECLRCGIIITTARNQSADRVLGAKVGADIYLVKPVHLEELASLIHNLARRLRGERAEAWCLFKTSWELATPSGRRVKLTLSEHAVLERLAHSPGLAVKRSELAEALGHSTAYYDFRRMEVLVRRLRSKVREQLGETLPLETAHSVGYAFIAPIIISD